MNQDLDMKARVKQILKGVQEIAPGRSVELRIPPFAAIQCIEGGTHRRGTPPNVVEMDAKTLITLLDNPEQWQQLCDTGSISASGTNSNLAKIFAQVSKMTQMRLGQKNG
jgi:hypothetical protein